MSCKSLKYKILSREKNNENVNFEEILTEFLITTNFIIKFKVF